MNRKRHLPSGESPIGDAPPTSKHKKTRSAAQPASSSAGQPASAPQPAPDRVCFLTHMGTTQRLHLPEAKMDMLLSLRTAVELNPAVIVVAYKELSRI